MLFNFFIYIFVINNDNNMNTKEFIEKSILIHGNKYDYSKTEYVNRDKKVKIICPIHGEFEQTPRSHLNGSICTFCRREIASKKREMTLEKFIEKSNKIHNNKFDYSKVNYIDLYTQVTIVCPIHGEFEQTPRKHLSGSGCLKCFFDKIKDNTETFIKKARLRHGDKYDYSKTIYSKSKSDVIITCKKHGDFKMTPNAHLRGQGCPKCGMEETKNKITSTVDDFILKSKLKYRENTFDYSLVNYVNNKTKVKLKCNKCGKIFEVVPQNHTNLISGCPNCSHLVSFWEKEVNDFINSLGIETETSNRSVLNGKEIDILIKEKNIGIECDGIIYHSELFNNDKNYHINKTKLCNDKGIYLIHIFEDEWRLKNNIVKSMIKNILCKNDTKIYARKCEIKEVCQKEKKEFLENNHIQGDVNSKINLGLFYNNELVSLMTFGDLRINLGSKKEDGSYELLRFCNKLNTSVIGGASKLFKYFIKIYDFKKIKSYCDLRWFKGNLYEILGFNLIRISKPNYFYTKGNFRENRFKYRKDILVKNGFDKNKTEHQIMFENKYYRIYDCGCKVYEFNNLI